MVEFLKSGNKIHIKESTRGSFTRWCGGEVTDECIKRGKNSPNSAIRKKATFAANARKWRNGGNIKIVIAEEGTNTKNFFQKAGNFLKSNPQLINTALNGISSIVSANKSAKAADQYAEAKKQEMKAYTNKTWAEKYSEALKNQKDRSDVVNMSRAYNQASGDVAQDVQEKQQQINQEISEKMQQAQEEQGNAWGSALSGVVQTFANSLIKKKKDASNDTSQNNSSNTSTNTNNTSYFSNYTNNQFSNNTSSNFWTNPTLGGTTLNSYSNSSTFF